ncbi:hyaluronoglucosaminidase [Streptococcus dysgalactiae]|uniref:hyaluronate lyase N-terminal domain-containing protein n=1 Tax=Streptococcus dysgalactiae TaxID=1334 RepID=UPI001FAB29C6|nr:hyaluronoglucosaminidase [Streptococcus dysgalactiae]
MTSVETIPIKIIFDRKDASEWQSTNPVIDAGEMVVELDTHKLKVGDGKLNYNDLPYYEGPQGESITKVQLSENGDLSVWIGDKETKLGNIKAQKGDKGTSITDITKDGEALTIKLSDDTQKTFNIPNGQKGDKGNSVTSARVDESGDFYVTIEGQSEKLLGNIKGGKGDPLKFEDLTPDQIAQIKAKDVDLSSYATKAELKEIDVSKQLTDYLSKTDAERTYLKKSDKVELPTDLVKTGDIADVVRKQELTSYATKDELKNKVDTLTITKLQATIESKLDKATADAAYLTKDGVSGIAVAKVITDVSQATDSNILYLIKG